MKICFLTRLDPHDYRSWSGTCHEMFKHLALHHDVQWIGNKHLSLWLKGLIRVQTFFEKLIGVKRGYAHFNKWHCYLKAKYVEKKLKSGNFDLIFSSNSPDFIAYLKTDIPILYSRDTTFNLFINYYPSFFGLKKRQIKEGNEIERLAIEKSCKIVYSSEWAAASAVDFYGAERSKIAILHFGANLIYEPKIENIQPKTQEEVCHLLFVGVNWIRKGGQVAYQTFKRLRAEGFNCRLTIVGCEMDFTDNDPNLEHISFLDKNNRTEFDRLYELYSKAHFVLLPTIADCTPIVFSEAAAFGIPVLTSDTGGNSSVVREGVNGYLFPAGADESFYADKIKKVFTDKQLYLKLRKKSRVEFEERLSWKIWIREINKMIDKNASTQIVGLSQERYYYEEGH